MLPRKFILFCMVFFSVGQALSQTTININEAEVTFDTVVYSPDQSLAVLVKDKKIGLLNMETNEVVVPCEFDELQVNMGFDRLPWVPAEKAEDVSEKYRLNGRAYYSKNYSQLNTSLFFQNSGSANEYWDVCAAYHASTQTLTVSIYARREPTAPYWSVDASGNITDSVQVVEGQEPQLVYPPADEWYLGFIQQNNKIIYETDSCMIMARPDFLFPGHRKSSSFFVKSHTKNWGLLPFYTTENGINAKEKIPGKPVYDARQFLPPGFSVTDPGMFETGSKGPFNAEHGGKQYTFEYEAYECIPRLITAEGKTFISGNYYYDNDTVGKFGGDVLDGNYILGVATSIEEKDDYILHGRDHQELYVNKINEYLMDEDGGSCFGLIKNGNHFLRIKTTIGSEPQPFTRYDGEGNQIDSVQCCDDHGQPIYVVGQRLMVNKSGVYDKASGKWILEPVYSLIYPYKTGYFVQLYEYKEVQKYKWALVLSSGYYNKGKWVLPLSENNHLFFEGNKLYQAEGEKMRPVKN